MQENEFEKQVHRELEGFKLSPSDGVWLKVEEKIREKKRRRWLLFLLFPFLLGGAATYYLLQNNRATEKEPANNSVSISFPAVEEFHNSTTNSGTENAAPAATAGLTEKKSAKNDSRTQPGPGKRETARTKKPFLSGSGETGNEGVIVKAKDKKSPAVGGNLPRYQKEPVNTTGISSDPVTRSIVASADGDKDQQNPFSMIEGRSDGERAELLTAGKENFPAGLTDSRFPDITVTKEQNEQLASSSHRNDRGWEWGLYAKMGADNLSKGFFHLLQPVRYAGNFSSPSTGSPGGPYIPSTPSPEKAGLSYGIGFMVSKEVHPRLRLFSGLNYAYYSTSRKTGMRIDSLITLNGYLNSYYYPTGTQQVHRSSYHFIEWPLGIQWRLNPRGNLPLHLRTQLAATWLLSGDGVSYSQSRQVYSDDQNLIRRMQIQSGFGLDFTLGKNSAHPLQLGPAVQYNWTSFYKTVDKNLTSENRNLFFAGIRAYWTLSKK